MQIFRCLNQIQEHRIYRCYPKERTRFTSCFCSTTSLSRYWSWLTSLPTLYQGSYHLINLRNSTWPRCLSRRI
jgi:hypothetical protein